MFLGIFAMCAGVGTVFVIDVLGSQLQLPSSHAPANQATFSDLWAYIAHGFAQLVKLTSALVLVPMFRSFWTWFYMAFICMTP